MNTQKFQLKGLWTLDGWLEHRSLLKFRSLKAIVLACITLSLTILISCVQQPADPLRVGTILWPGYDNLYLAKELNYYNKAPIRLNDYATLEAAIRAFRNSETEVVMMPLMDALTIAETQPDVRVVLLVDVSNGADVLLVKSSIQSIQDLKGKRIGVEPTALGSLMLTRSLETAKLAPKDVQIVPVGISGHVEVLKQNKVDAVITYEPFRSELLATGAKQLFDSSQIPNQISDVMVVRENVLTSRSADLQGLVNGWFKARAYFEQNREDSIKRLAPRNNMTPQQLTAAWKGLRTPDLQENQKLLSKTDPALLEKTRELVALMVKGKFLKQTLDPTLLLDDRLVKEVKLE